MCQILFSEKANPPEEVMTFANANNKDGFGYAYVEGKVVKYQKGFDQKEHTKEFIKAYHALPFPKAIHYRLATHGGICRELTHPFPIKRGVPLSLEGEAPAVLFHNGIWSSWDEHLRQCIYGGTLNPNILKQLMSDSRALAILAQRFGPDILDVADLNSNKVLVLTHETWYRYGSWNHRDGYSASNPRIDPPTVTIGSGAETAWSHHGHKNDRRWKSLNTQKSMYLDASREEIEDQERLWKERFDG